MSDLPEGQEQEITLRDELASALQGVKDKDAVEAGQPLDESPSAVAARARDEAGRFTKAEAAKVSQSSAAPTTGEPLAGAETVPAAVAAIKPPDGWKAEAKAKFATLPPDIQAEINRRETEAHQKITSQDQDRDLGKRIREESGPYQAIMQAEQTTPGAAYRDYLNTAYILRTGSPQAKAQAVAAVIQSFGVPLPLIAQAFSVQPGMQLQPQQPQYDPAEIARQAADQVRQELAQTETQRSIAAFAAEAGHEHFEAVKPRMAVLLKEGQAETLQDAYDQAIWSDNSIRSTLLAAQAAGTNGKRLTEQKAVTDAAKRAAGSIAGGPGSAKPNGAAPGDRSLRDEIRANLAASTGRI